MFAIVNVLPEPVTPTRVSNWLPSSKPFVSASIACGWSPIGLKSECNTNLSIKPSLLNAFFSLYNITAKKYRTNIRFVLYFIPYLYIRYSAALTLIFPLRYSTAAFNCTSSVASSGSSTILSGVTPLP